MIEYVVSYISYTFLYRIDEGMFYAALPVQQRDGGAGAVVVGGEAGQRLCRG